jgi:hypothetical protein
MFKMFLKSALVSAIGAGVFGCESNAGTGAIVGGVGGAAVGGLIGSNSHARAGEGALIGAAAGAIGGALIGHSMDKNDEKAKRKEDEKQYRDAQPQVSRVSTSDVIDWSRNGTKEDVIVDRIQRSGATFVSSADEKQMKAAGVSDRVIGAMKSSGRG